MRREINYAIGHLGENAVKKVHKRIMIILGILVLAGVTGVVAEFAGSFAFFINVPIVIFIILLVWLLVKKSANWKH
jgi:hypothetical protein